MTNLTSSPTASELIARLRNDIARINDVLTSEPAQLTGWATEELELAEINLCFAETMTTDDHAAAHYAREGLRSTSAILCPF